MTGVLIAFRLKSPHDPNVASALVKKLYGQNTSSHKGRYRYRRRGLLDEIPYRRLIRGVIIIRTKDQDQVLELLNSFDAEIFVRNVELTTEDNKTLAME